MEPQATTDEERLERIRRKLMDKVMEPNRPPGPLLGPEGFVSPEFANDLRALPPHLVIEIEEYAQIVEEMVDGGMVFIGEPRLREPR